MKKSQNKKLSLWQKLKLKFWLVFKHTIPEDCKFGAIDAMSVKQVKEFRYPIIAFEAKDLHPLFCERNSAKLKVLCEYSNCVGVIKKYLEKNGNDDEIRAFLNLRDKEISLDWAEKYFIGRNPDDFFLPYLKKHLNWLPTDVVTLLIERKQETLLCLYLTTFEKGNKHNINTELLFDSSLEMAKREFADKFVADNGDKHVIKYIFKCGSDELIERLLQEHELSLDEEFCWLFETENPKFIDLAIKRKKQSYLSPVFWDFLLKKGTVAQINECIDKSYLNNQNVYALVLSENNEAILHYLEKVTEPIEDINAETYLFKHASADVLDFYRKNISLPYEEERKFFKSAGDAEICSYIKQAKHGINTMNAVLLVVSSNSVEVLTALLEKETLSVLTEAHLLRRNIPEVTDFYIKKLINKKQKLSDVGEKEFIKTGDIDLICKYLRAFDYDLNDKGKEALLNRGNAALLSKFCSKASFDENMVAKFVKNAPADMLLSYFKNGITLPPKAEASLIYSQYYRNRIDVIRAYFENINSLSTCGECALIRLKDKNLIKEYLTSFNDLYQKSEKELLLLKDKDLFLFYIERTALFDDNEIFLIQSGLDDWLEAYIEKYDLGKYAAYELAKKL